MRSIGNSYRQLMRPMLHVLQVSCCACGCIVLGSWSELIEGSRPSANQMQMSPLRCPGLWGGSNRCGDGAFARLPPADLFLQAQLSAGSGGAEGGGVRHGPAVQLPLCRARHRRAPEEAGCRSCRAAGLSLATAARPLVL